MATKLPKGTYPNGHSPDDFKCFGPPAATDGVFEGTMMADMGCFKQDGTDSNKFYHGAVVQSKKDSAWYAYFEWGRTGKSSSDIQFVQCSSKEEAEREYAKQMHSKNDKRGEWVKLAGKDVLRAKAGKDCYLIRPLAKRTHGLPDAQAIVHDDSGVVGKDVVKDDKPKKKTSSKKKAPAADPITLKLMKDMAVATVEFTRSTIESDAVPTLGAIEEGRDVLIAAEKRVKKIGEDAAVEDQVADKELRELTYHLYSRIGKPKPLRASDAVWILSKDNIARWRLDLDAFESALYSLDTGVDATDDSGFDPFGGMNIDMVHLDPSSTREGEFIHNWMPDATRNRHGHVGNMNILNAWAVRQRDLAPKFDATVERIAGERFRSPERPIAQPQKRTDLSAAMAKRYASANVGLLFHGTRSVNVPGILRTGLRLPKELVGVVITGAMFGPGVYWADDWKKSDGYTSRSGGYWSGGGGAVKGRKAFMFVANVALGKPHVASGPKGYTGPPSGCHSVFGKAGHSHVQNNEWIVYDSSQNSLGYLVEYDVTGGSRRW
tara:strand:+ start:57042 stop:58685 length:1644 start_codon:yes stop_codon:yes gene_type:complete